MDRLTKIFRVVLPIYWAFLTYMLLRPGVENKEYWFMFPHIDKLMHFSIFGFLAVCVLFAFPRLRFLMFVQLMLAYGILTEILQDIMGYGRSLELLDIVADILGALVGYGIYRIAKSYLERTSTADNLRNQLD
ncbi:MAG: VanZ family protein [Chryseobacterium sp.]|nr:MAG: VanZ family protein [Chryseobacterium sp.]